MNSARDFFSLDMKANRVLAYNVLSFWEFFSVSDKKRPARRKHTLKSSLIRKKGQVLGVSAPVAIPLHLANRQRRSVKARR